MQAGKGLTSDGFLSGFSASGSKSVFFLGGGHHFLPLYVQVSQTFFFVKHAYFGQHLPDYCSCYCISRKKKMIKTRLCNLNGGKSLSHLMKILIESPEKSVTVDLENIVDVWNRKIRRIVVRCSN